MDNDTKRTQWFSEKAHKLEQMEEGMKSRNRQSHRD